MRESLRLPLEPKVCLRSLQRPKSSQVYVMAKYTIRHDKTDKGNRILDDGKFALGFISGALFVVFAYIAHDLVKGARPFSDILEIAPVTISLIVALGSTYFAASALLEQRRTREAGTDPVLIAHLGQREDAREVVTFKVSNVGAGAALNIHLEVDRPEDEPDDWIKRDFWQNIFFRHHPFSTIPQGNSIEFSLGFGWCLVGQDRANPPNPKHPLTALPPFRARLTYEDLAGGKYSSEFVIDVREMTFFEANRSPQMRAVAALESIAKKTR